MESKYSPIRQLPSGGEVKKLKDVFFINELSLPANTSVDYQFHYITLVRDKKS